MLIWSEAYVHGQKRNRLVEMLHLIDHLFFKGLRTAEPVVRYRDIFRIILTNPIETSPSLLTFRTMSWELSFKPWKSRLRNVRSNKYQVRNRSLHMILLSRGHGVSNKIGSPHFSILRPVRLYCNYEHGRKKCCEVCRWITTAFVRSNPRHHCLTPLSLCSKKSDRPA